MLISVAWRSGRPASDRGSSSRPMRGRRRRSPRPCDEVVTNDLNSGLSTVCACERTTISSSTAFLSGGNRAAEQVFGLLRLRVPGHVPVRRQVPGKEHGGRGQRDDDRTDPGAEDDATGGGSTRARASPSGPLAQYALPGATLEIGSRSTPSGIMGARPTTAVSRNSHRGVVTLPGTADRETTLARPLDCFCAFHLPITSRNAVATRRSVVVATDCGRFRLW